MLSPDDICSNATEKGVKIRMEQRNGFVLIEGRKEDLMFLGELFSAIANDQREGRFQIYPDGAGSLLFDDGSNVGIYINKI